jgi:putative ABC transport system permease protein
MILLEMTKTAFNSLFVNKLRTFLTLLGIVIGIMSVITLINIGQSAQKYIENSISSLGSNLISITPGKSRTGSSLSVDLSAFFTMDQLDTVLKTPKYYVAGVTTQAQAVLKVQYETNDLNLSVTGVYGDFWNVRTNFTIEEGVPISTRNIDSLEKVAVVGPDLVGKLFNNEDPIGKKVKINSQTFTVIGVTKAQGSNGITNPDEGVLIPLTTLQKFLTGNDKIQMIIASVKDPNLLGQAQAELTNILRKARGLKAGDENDFTIRNTQQALTVLDQITGVLTVFLSAIAAISLLVGGIGIMNIMFVTVNERTKEIGLRKSLGATRNDILLQFLAEAMAVTLVGGVIGTTLGITLTYVATTLASLPFVLSGSSILLAVGVSVSIGLVFGIYPAWKAAQLSPIDALRYE